MADPPLINLPQSQTGDVSPESVAGRDVVHHQGIDAAPVVKLLGERLERRLERQADILSALVLLAALLVVSQIIVVALWGPTIWYIVGPAIVAGA